MSDLVLMNEKKANDLFDDLFNSAQKDVFRLELFPEYRVEEEKTSFAYFKRYGKNPHYGEEESYGQWVDLLQKKKDQGVKYWRVRRLSSPMTDYEKFEVASYKLQANVNLDVWAFKHSPDYLKIDQLNKVPYVMDYWMFDKKDILFIQYDLMGKYIATWKYTGDPKPYVRLANALKKISKKIA